MTQTAVTQTVMIEPLDAMRRDGPGGRMVPNNRCPACQADALRFDRTEEPPTHNVYACGSCGKEHRYRFGFTPYTGSRRPVYRHSDGGC